MKTKLAFPKPKKQSKKTPRQKAWEVFSRFIRLRDCEAYQKGEMVAPCFTCERVTHYSELQAGHFLQGRGNGILFDEAGVHSQCKRCNIFLRGNPDAYWPKMIKIYGWETVQEMVWRKNQIYPMSTKDYEAIIKIYEKVS